MKHTRKRSAVRVRRRFDLERLRQAVSGPGTDPRTWVSAARVETDPDAATFDAKLGWLVDVAFYGGGLDGVQEVPCRWLSVGAAGDGFGEYIPPKLGAEVLVAVVDGDPGANPVVLGTLTNEDDASAPTEINALPIDGAASSSTPAAVAPKDTEIKRSPYNRREQFDGELTTQAKAITLKADEPLASLKLGSETAKASFVLGEELVLQLGTALDAIVTALGTGSNGGGAVVFAGLPALMTALGQVKAVLSSPQVLSPKIKGE